MNLKKESKNQILFYLDLGLTVVITILMLDYYVLLSQVLVILSTSIIGSETSFITMIIVRFVVFSSIHGIEGSYFYFTVFVAFMKISFVTSQSLIPFFNVFWFIFTFVCDTFSGFFPSTTDDTTRLWVNAFSRCYVVLYFVVEIMYFKCEAIEEEKNLLDEALELETMEGNELGFMKRFSHFSKTNLNGVINFLWFMQNSLKSFTLSKEDSKISKELKERFEMIEHSSVDIIYQTNNIVTYYESKHDPSQAKKTGVEEEKKPDDDDKESAGEVNDTKRNRKCKKVTNCRVVLNYVVTSQKKLRFEVMEQKKERVKVSVTVDPSVPKTVQLDPSLLLQVLNNTISNAFKYTSMGSIDVKMSTKMNSSQHSEESSRPSPSLPSLNLVLTIKDTGKGIKKEMLDKIFDPFVHNDEDKDGDESFSIGLYGVKHTLESLGGEIKITSEGKGKGTSCVVIIPCEEVEKYDPKIIKREEEESEGEEEEEEGSNNNNHGLVTDLSHVLIVEDNIINQKVFEKQIRSYLGTTCEESGAGELRIIKAENGERGLEELSRIGKFEPIILCDIDMPVMNGHEFVREVRKRYSSLVFVIYCFTGTIIGSRKDRFFKNGFDDVHSKPVTYRKMKVILSSMVREREMRRMNRVRRFSMYLRNQRKSCRRRLIPAFDDVGQFVNCKDEEEENGSVINEITELLFQDNVQPSTFSFPGPETVSGLENYKFGGSDNNNNNNEEEAEKEVENDLGSVFEKKMEEHEHQVGKKKILVDVLAGVISNLCIWGCGFVHPPDSKLRTQWTYQAIFYTVTNLIQYSSTFLFFGLSVEMNSILSSLRNFFAFFFGSTLSNVIQTMKTGYVLQVAFILQTIQSVKSFRASLALTLCYLVEIIFFEMTRSREYVLRTDSFVHYVDLIALYYLVFTSISLPSFMRSTIQERRSRMEGTIQEKKNIDRDVNCMMSRISHDLSNPAQTLLCHLNEVYDLLCNYHHHNRNFKQQLVDEETFRDLIHSSVTLECSIRNFLVCCKLRNGMLNLQKKLQYEISQGQFLNISEAAISVTKNLLLLKSPKCKVHLKINKEEQNQNFSHDPHLHPHKKKKHTLKIQGIDYSSFQIVLMNLLINSLVHSSAENIWISIQTTTNEPLFCTVSVEDDGVGMKNKKEILGY